MKDTRWRLFSYLVIDHKAAQADPTLEYQRFRKKVMRRIAMTAVLPQLPWVVYFLWLFGLEGTAPPAESPSAGC